MLRKDDQVEAVQSSFLFPLLEDICDRKNPYVRLAHVIDWERIVALVEPCFVGGAMLPEGNQGGAEVVVPKAGHQLAYVACHEQLERQGRDREMVDGRGLAVFLRDGALRDEAPCRSVFAVPVEDAAGGEGLVADFG